MVLPVIQPDTEPACAVSSLSEDVQMTDKITISKQFKENVIRPILKVQMVLAGAGPASCLAWVS